MYRTVGPCKSIIYENLMPQQARSSIKFNNPEKKENKKQLRNGDTDKTSGWSQCHTASKGTTYWQFVFLAPGILQLLQWVDSGGRVKWGIISGKHQLESRVEQFSPQSLRHQLLWMPLLFLAPSMWGKKGPLSSLLINPPKLYSAWTHFKASLLYVSFFRGRVWIPAQ